MKKIFPYLGMALCFLVLLGMFECNNSNSRNIFQDEIAERDSTINIQKYIINGLRDQMKIDSIQYEKEKKHIKELRDRYPDNAILDSLFRAGQSIN